MTPVQQDLMLEAAMTDDKTSAPTAKSKIVRFDTQEELEEWLRAN